MTPPARFKNNAPADQPVGSDPSDHSCRSGPSDHSCRSGPSDHSCRSGPSAHSCRSDSSGSSDRPCRSDHPAPLCGCSSHPEDGASQKIVSKMADALGEVIALSSGPVYLDFISNPSLQSRLMELLEKVQKNAQSLPADYKNRKPKADWAYLESLPSQIVHPVYGMNPETLWDVVRLEIPYQHKMLGIIINGCSHDS